MEVKGWLKGAVEANKKSIAAITHLHNFDTSSDKSSTVVHNDASFSSGKLRHNETNSSFCDPVGEIWNIAV